MDLCFPMEIKKRTDVTSNIRDDLITVNKVFAHWVKEIDLQRYGDDLQIILATNSVEIYR